MRAHRLRCLSFLPMLLALSSAAFPHSQFVYPGARGYMEMIFLPPVTTGPWSPDGREIAFSMRGGAYGRSLLSSVRQSS